MCWLFAFSALANKQRHHVCEDPRSLGRALQIRRADEHPHAFQVKQQANVAVYVSVGAALMGFPPSFKEKMLLYRLEEQNLGQVSRLEVHNCLTCSFGTVEFRSESHLSLFPAY